MYFVYIIQFQPQDSDTNSCHIIVLITLAVLQIRKLSHVP